MDLARKHAKRSKELARFLAQALAGGRAEGRAPASPALAWELSQAAARLAPDEPEAFPGRDACSRRPTCGRVLGEIRDQWRAREGASRPSAQRRPDWAEIFIEQIGARGRRAGC